MTYSEPGPQAGSHWKTGKDLSESRISSSSHWVEGKGWGEPKTETGLVVYFLSSFSYAPWKLWDLQP